MYFLDPTKPYFRTTPFLKRSLNVHNPKGNKNLGLKLLPTSRR